MIAVQLTQKDYRFNNWALFFAFMGIYMGLSYYITHFIIRDQLYYNSFGDTIAMDRIEAYVSKQKENEWVGYALAPLLLLVKTGYTAVCISLGCFLAGIEMPFKKIYKVTLFAEVAILAGVLIQTVSLLLFKEINTLEDVQNFAPFSLYGLMGTKDTPTYLNYPLRVINIFEVAYWILLALGLKVFLQKPFGKMLRLVLATYGIGLLVWVVFVVFLSINLTT